MSTAAPLQNTAAKSTLVSNSPNTGLLSQSKYAFGVSKSSLTSEYEGKTRLQAELSIGASNDPLEQEADRVADQVLAAPIHSAVSGAAPSIQRFTGQSTGDAGTAPASVDRVLSGSGRPLDPAIQQDMGQRFGHDFSRVRVHTGTAAEQSARDVNSNAYVVGNNVVFGVGQFAPQTHYGKRLLAHELTHVIQQAGSPQFMWGTSSANMISTRRPEEQILSRSTLHTDKDLYNMMQKFRSKNDHLTEAQQNKIFWAIKKATDSDEVAYKFFDYYSGYLGAGNKIKLMTSIEEANAKKTDTLAETPSGGDTKLRSDVFTLPDETLGPLLLHEFAHTGHHTNWGGAYDFEEGQAYGIEYYYAERTGDTTRMSKIITIISSASARWTAALGPVVQENFKVTYALMHELGNLTKSGSSTLPPLKGKVGDDGRLMASEFVSSFSDLSKDLILLWDHIKKNLTSFKVPII